MPGGFRALGKLLRHRVAVRARAETGWNNDHFFHIYKLEFVLLFLIKRTAISNTLIVLFRVLAYHNRFFHFHSEMLLDKIYGGQNGQIGIALTATRPADIANFTQWLCRHLVRQSKRFLCQWCGFGDDGDEHAWTDSCTASPPEATSPSRHTLSTIHHFRECRLKVYLPSCILVGLIIS